MGKEPIRAEVVEAGELGKFNYEIIRVARPESDKGDIFKTKVFQLYTTDEGPRRDYAVASWLEDDYLEAITEAFSRTASLKNNPVTTATRGASKKPTRRSSGY